MAPISSNHAASYLIARRVPIGERSATTAWSGHFRDPWHRILQRWASLFVIGAFVCLLAASLVGLWFHLYSASNQRAMASGVAGGFVAWLIRRPLVVAAAAVVGREPACGRVDGVSVVIPCYNAAHKIEATVESILASTVRDVEILLVENNSTDDTWLVLQRLEARLSQVRALRVAVRPDEYAASVAINHGVANASHEAIFRMDDDTVMSPTMIEEAAGALMSPETSAVAVNLRVSNPRESIFTRLQAMEYMLAMELDRRFQVLFGSVLCCSGGLAAFRRRTILESKGFCSAPKWVSEDLDMTMKSHRLGRVRVAHRAVGYTEVPSTLKALVKQRYRWGISGVVAFYLHKRGIGRRSYWYDGRVGFFGLPLLGVIRARDMVAFGYVYLIASAVYTGHADWLLALAGIRMALLALQLLLMTGLLHERQGVYYYWLIPLFVLVYGPILLVARFAGSWTGLVHVRRLRATRVRLEHAGLSHDSHLSRGLTLEPAPTAPERLAVADPNLASACPNRRRPPLPRPPRPRSTRMREVRRLATQLQSSNWQPVAVGLGAAVVIVAAHRLRQPA